MIFEKRIEVVERVSRVDVLMIENGIQRNSQCKGHKKCTWHVWTAARKPLQLERVKQGRE